jgi:hypothetical protein
MDSPIWGMITSVGMCHPLRDAGLRLRARFLPDYKLRGLRLQRPEQNRRWKETLQRLFCLHIAIQFCLSWSKAPAEVSWAPSGAEHSARQGR